MCPDGQRTDGDTMQNTRRSDCMEGNRGSNKQLQKVERGGPEFMLFF